MTGRQMDFTSDLPEDMAAVIEKWRNYIRNIAIT
jgi:23S rRNA pseudouridine1911/1915/1917 synthase